MDKYGTASKRAGIGIVEGVATMATPAVSEGQATSIAEMMRRLGIEGVVPQLNLIYAAAVQQCEACRSKQACREWLDSMPQALVSAPDFCPNAEILFELRASQPGHAVASNNLAHIADLERFEDEIDDLLLQKPNDDPTMAELKCRKARLQDAIEWLRHKGGAKRFTH
jgi:hypothetical protein